MLTEDVVADSGPILAEDFFAYSMRANIIRAEPLHSKVVDKAVLHAHLHLLQDHFVADLSVDEAQSDGESVSAETAQSERLVNALKRAYLDFAVPVFGALLANQVFSIAAVDSQSLGRNAAFVLVACDLELFWHLLHPFGNIVHCDARFHVGLLHNHRQVVGIVLHIFLRSLILLTQFLPLPVLVAHARDQEQPDLADHLIGVVDDRVRLVFFDVRFEVAVNFGSLLFVRVIRFKAE